MSSKAVVEIVQQPASVDRFRYKSERRNRSQVVNNCQKTLGAIRVLHYTGTVTCVVSCVTAEKPYRQHPNILVGQDCRRGVCTITFNTDETDPTVHTFQHMAIQCSKKGDVYDVLTEREKCNVDPFKTGFGHKNEKTFKPAIRLCFQVLLRSTKTDVKMQALFPRVSDIISRKDVLEIVDISDTTSPTAGMKTIVVFCSKVTKDDVKVRFYQEDSNGRVQWEMYAIPTTVHRQAAVSFETPCYATNNISDPVHVYLQLVRPSDGKRSEPPLSFSYVPDLSNGAFLIKKMEEKVIRSQALFEYIQRLGNEKRKRVEMEQQQHANTPPSLNPNITPMHLNQNSNVCSTASPPVRQSNFDSNLFCQDQAPIDSNYQSHFENSSFLCNQMQQSSAEFLPSDIDEDLNLCNEYVQHQMQTYENGTSSQNSRQQSGSNGYHQPHSYLLPTDSNPGYGGKYLSSAEPYYPVPSFYNPDQMYHPVQSNGKPVNQ